MRVNAGATDGKKALVLALHGAGGTSESGLWIFRGGAKTRGLVLVAPASESRTWNIFYGADLDTIDRALRQAFARCRVDARRVAVGGFSDGATTALSVGLLNGDLFRAVMAVAPGGIIAERPVGKPRVYIAHGTRDTVLPFRIGQAVTRELRSFGYAVKFRAFAGAHDVPDGISREAVRWFLGT
jgi:predicted esterase